MIDTMSIVNKIANSVKLAKHPHYQNSIFEDFCELAPNTKGKLVEAMVAEILEKEGHEVFDNTNQQHDLRVRFKGENHKTKLEIKSAMLNRSAGMMFMGAFNLAQDFDEVMAVLLYPNKVSAYRINRSVLRGMDNDGLLKISKQGNMIAGLSDVLLESYDCPRVI